MVIEQVKETIDWLYSILSIAESFDAFILCRTRHRILKWQAPLLLVDPTIEILKIGDSSIFIKNAKPAPSVVDPIIEILKIGIMTIFIKNAKPTPSVADPIIEILKIGSMSIFIKNAKPDLWWSELTLMNERQEERLSLPI